MNKLNLSGFGGHPFTSDDLEFESAAVREALKGILSFGDYGFNGADKITVISGVAVFDGGTTFSVAADGYVSIGGEIFYVAVQAPAAKAGGGSYCFKIVETNEAAGNVTYLNASSQNTWKKRVATVAHDTSGLLLYDLVKAQYGYQMKQVIDNFNTWDYPNPTSWATPSLSAPFHVSALIGKDIFKYRVDAYGVLRFRGRLLGTNPGGTIMTLPAALNPGRWIHLAIPGFDYSTGNTFHFYAYINPAGQMITQNGAPASNFALDFNTIQIQL